MQTLATRRHRLEASTIRLSVPADKRRIDPSADDDERIEHGIIERRSSSSHAKAVRHGTLISRKDMDPIGGTFELVICRFKRAGRTGEVEHLEPWRNVKADRLSWPNHREV